MLAAREEGKYRAIGGHKARPGKWVVRSTNAGDFYYEACAVCGREVTEDWRGYRHKPRRRVK